MKLSAVLLGVLAAFPPAGGLASEACVLRFTGYFVDMGVAWFSVRERDDPARWRKIGDVLYDGARIEAFSPETRTLHLRREGKVIALPLDQGSSGIVSSATHADSTSVSITDYGDVRVVCRGMPSSAFRETLAAIHKVAPDSVVILSNSLNGTEEVPRAVFSIVRDIGFARVRFEK